MQPGSGWQTLLPAPLCPHREPGNPPLAGLSPVFCKLLTCGAEPGTQKGLACTANR